MMGGIVMRQYAVNISDLTKYWEEGFGLHLLLGDVLDRRHVSAEPDVIDGMAVLLNCEEERAKAIIWWVWNKMGYRPNLLRFYRSSERAKSGWVRVRLSDVEDA